MSKLSVFSRVNAASLDVQRRCGGEGNSPESA